MKRITDPEFTEWLIAQPEEIRDGQPFPVLNRLAQLAADLAYVKRLDEHISAIVQDRDAEYKRLNLRIKELNMDLEHEKTKIRDEADWLDSWLRKTIPVTNREWEIMLENHIAELRGVQ